MPELTFAHKSKLEVSEPQDIDFNATGKIYILIGDIAPQDIIGQFTYYFWDVKQTISDFADGWKADLHGLYKNSEIEIDYETTYGEFLKALNSSDMIGVIFIGHGKEGRLAFVDLALLPTATSVYETDLQFIFLFACQAGMEVDKKTWETETTPDIFYAPENALRIDPSLPFLDTLASEGEQLIEELRELKRETQK